MTRLGRVTLVVHDYDDAVAWFTGALGFTLAEDTALGDGKRWVAVAPPGGGTSLLLARADTPEQAGAVGNQCGGRVGFFLQTDDFASDHAGMTARGVTFLEPPRREDYGTVAVFVDLCGNKWDLVEAA